ncbi:hypothetical protein J4727_14725 [Providencia rettgeri]|uniref:Uncharacterized protein n=1 Tax=Providencia rettgeri TaxID=587 RepID=A0A939NF03_PRORE|nr:hypothetical protein [Providencia rettgeri]
MPSVKTDFAAESRPLRALDLVLLMSYVRNMALIEIAPLPEAHYTNPILSLNPMPVVALSMMRPQAI